MAITSPYEDFPGTPGNTGNINPGIDHQRTAIGSALITDKDQLEKLGLPITLWEEQTARYMDYWAWFTGARLDEAKGETKNGQKVSKFPLRINSVRNFARKHAALLFGEHPNSPQPFVQTKIKPAFALYSDDEDDPPDEMKDRGRFLEALVNQVWLQSDGRTIQQENGLLSQFLGGCAFQIKYQPWRKDLLIPIRIESIIPDYILPIWQSDDYYRLSECWIVYRISAQNIKAQHGITPVNTDRQWVTYVEHWTREKYSIYIDGEPLRASYRIPGEKESINRVYKDLPNPFGFVPIVYIPRLREGSFYGPSIVPDIAGLVLELNGRMSDVGTIIMQTAHRKWIGRNITGNIKPKDFANGEEYNDLGMQNPAVNNPPELWPEDPPTLSNYITEFNKILWDQLLREANLTPIAFGEDEGSQRSALTLAIRFWPTTVIARMQRTFWEAGLNQLARYILDMIAVWMEQDRTANVGGKRIKRYEYREYTLRQDWLPIVPRDREQLVNEVVLLGGGKQQMSTYRGLETLGDVEDIQEELDRIREEQEFDAKLQLEQKEAEMSIEKPVAESGANPDN